jgi:excisionase family DNA binding protein
VRLTQLTLDSLDDHGARSLSVAQACSALHVSRRTVYYLIKSGRVATVRTPLGSQRVLVDSLKAMRLQPVAHAADRGSDDYRAATC